MEHDDPPTPYRDAAPIYRAAGWSGVLPIPFGTKKLAGRKATGWTGHAGRWPSGADVHAWCESNAPDEGGGNVALRLPPDVIGLDVDAYAGKDGGRTLDAALAKWGELPPTWTSTARDDGTSGIRLFRVDDGLRWPGQIGAHVEIIQVSHRYAVVWPSVHPEGGRYRWVRPDGLPSTAPPEPDDLPALPDRWVAALTGGELAEDVRIADLSVGQVREWIHTHQHGAGPMCGAMSTTLRRLLEELPAGSAHEALRRLHGLARLAEQGHHGLTTALHHARTAFHTEVTRPDRHGQTRSTDDAEAEFRRSLAGAVRRVVGSPACGPDEQPVDPCDDPFAAIVDPGDVTPAPPPAQLGQLAPPPAAHPELPPAPTVGPTGPAGGEAHAAPDSIATMGDTWRRRDLSSARTGHALVPTLLARTDKRCLFYPGKINALLGESESGKSWIALLAVAQEIEAGRNVVYLDFEDTEFTLVQRLDALGCDPGVVDEHVAYLNPEEPLSTPAAGVLADELAAAEPSLVVLDGVNAAMALFGLDSNSTTDATRFGQILLARLVADGAGVITIDHVTKNKETRGKGGIGSQAKRAMISGAAVTAEVVTPFGRGMIGKIRLQVDKDRPGAVREHSAYAKSPGTVVIRSTIDPDRVEISIEPTDDRPVAEREAFRPTGVMERVSRYLASEAEPRSTRQIEDNVRGKRDVIVAALAALESGRYVDASDGPRGARLYRHEVVFREIDEMVEQDD